MVGYPRREEPMDVLCIGMATVDVIHYVDSTPGSNEKYGARQTNVYAGGPAANAAITIAKLGGSAHLVSAFGCGALASVIREELELYGVTYTDIAPNSAQTVIASVIVNIHTGDRTVVGVKPQHDQMEISVHPQACNPAAVLIDSYHTLAAVSCLEQISGTEAFVVLDGGSWKPRLAEVLRFVDYAVCSEHFLPPECSTLNEAAEYLHDQGIPFVCFTRGERPIIVYQRGKSPFMFPVTHAQQVTDTLAAGDIFHGAFCLRMVSTNRDVMRSLAYASEVAARSVRVSGPRDW